MYLPAHFRLDDPAQQLALMRRHAFATVVATVDGAPEAAHLPLLVDRVGDRFVIHGHVASGNALAKATSAMAVFAGPHAYVSSAWYEEPDTVPTWNYLAVHANGPLTWIADAGEQRALFERLIETFDPANASTIWGRLSGPMFARLNQAIRWFRLDAARVEAKAKLSQNHAPARRARAIAALRAGGAPDQLAIAEAMASGGSV
jgi:transcriptional regulator